MSDKLSNYNTKAADWRKQLATNDRKTIFVMFCFLVIYVIVGLVIDLYVHPAPHYVPLSQVLLELVTFRIVPICTIITFSAALISILISYAIYDKIVMLGTSHKEITKETASSLEEQQLYNVVEEMQIAAGLRYMPKVFIIEADYMNAFASGYSEKSALIAITTGLMRKLNRSELQAVIAHELTHIRHHDIKLTMAASIMCNILLIAIDIVFRGAIYGGIGRGRGRRERSGGNGGGAIDVLFLAIIVLRFLLPILTMILMLFLSRTREYMADAGAVELMRDNSPLANALLKIQSDHDENSEAYTTAYNNTAHEDVRRSSYIFDPSKTELQTRKSFSSLFSTHPAIEARLKAIGFERK